MNNALLHPPRASTDHLRLESFKTLSRLQLIFEFRPWLEYSREYTRRRVNSPYFLLWDCICFGAPLNTLLELIGSPTPRHLAVTADDFDFGLPIAERLPFFHSFIHRVQLLESQEKLSYGEVLKVEDFTAGLNAGFLRVLNTINRVLNALYESYPGIFALPHGSAARRASLMQQLIDSERAHTSRLTVTADSAAKLYEDPAAAHPTLEGFIINCSRLIPYHDHVLKILGESLSSCGQEDWNYIFSCHDKIFLTRMKISYRSICANYLTFHTFLKTMTIAQQSRAFASDILQNLSTILSRFSEYQDYLHAILSATPPKSRSSYDALCTVALETSDIRGSLTEVGHELRTMASFQLLCPRFVPEYNPLDKEPPMGTLLLDDCLIIDPDSGQYYSVFLFETTLLCCADHRRSDASSFSGMRYPIRPWEIGPALSQEYQLHTVMSIPTKSLKALHCIDEGYFQITWGNDSECCITFYPLMPKQYSQWIAVLEPFVSHVTHSTSVPHYLEEPDGTSVCSGVSLVPTYEEDKFDLTRRRSSARPWSLIGRKGFKSETSSLVGVEIEVKDREDASILSPNMLPDLFRPELPRSPLHISFVPDEAVPPLQLMMESPEEYSPPESIMSDDSLPDLTGQIVKIESFATAHGGYSDVWRAMWNKEGGAETRVAVKVLRTTAYDMDMREKLIERLNHEMRIWKSLSHPHVLKLYGTVSDFGPYTSMVCPWHRYGNITKYLERSGDIISMEDRLKMISEIADGLAYLHSCAIVHGDLTGSNILLDDDLHVQLCDFGLSSLLLEGCQEDSESVLSAYTSHLGGSVRWADSYLFRSFEDDTVPVIGTSSDVYSFGSVMLEVLSGRMPYHYLRTDHQVVIQLHQGIKPRRPATSFVNDSQWDLIQQCWKEPPERRPSAEELRQSTRSLLDPAVQQVLRKSA
ncbi:unnamed protein product [Cyclocybe aegerita]|uniref:Protein kinase domain-containing protein n=1 Tax=Cyclocybe aegerita TaxID=1973307 RepID=A0A8S0VYU4_CYCAE|nr:unnamed protein product [Cyclocybe aegerita]